MVLLIQPLFKQIPKRIRPHFRPHFLDSLRLTVSGGHGGSGLPKLGGVGGQGGCVYFKATEGMTLKDVVRKHQTKRISAGPGEDSHKYRILGKRGTDVAVPVPLGITVLRDDGKKLVDLDEEGKTFLAAGGGPGGCLGNSFIGEKGASKTLTLDLKLIADVGLVGFPNAGKSTFLKGISNANPKIASYPFTTIRPQLGIVEYTDYRQISIADLPGLIEGAHVNFGMGHKFLKHVERTRVLLLIVDVFGFQLNPQLPKRNLIENIFALNKELEMYDEQLLKKPAILLLNKMDIEGATQEVNKYEDIIGGNWEKGLEQCPEEIRPDKLIAFERIVPISAKDKTEIEVVKDKIRNVLDLEEEKNLDAPDVEEMKAKLVERGPRLV